MRRCAQTKRQDLERLIGPGTELRLCAFVQLFGLAPADNMLTHSKIPWADGDAMDERSFSDISRGDAVPAYRQVAAALVLLTALGLLMRVSFHRLYQFVRRYPTASATPHASDPLIILRVEAALRRACLFYPREARCLQKSAVLVCLLRRAGVPAELVIGVCRTPFRAHAWVEVSGAIINGPQNLKARASVIERL